VKNKKPTVGFLARFIYAYVMTGKLLRSNTLHRTKTAKCAKTPKKVCFFARRVLHPPHQLEGQTNSGLVEILPSVARP
jgi:hypothetical protein